MLNHMQVGISPASKFILIHPSQFGDSWLCGLCGQSRSVQLQKCLDIIIPPKN